MEKNLAPTRREDQEDNLGCAYVLDEPTGSRTCGARRQPTSSYCTRHHALCYIACGSRAEIKRLREVEALASAVGGRRAPQGLGPSRQFLKRLEDAVRDFS
jgi:hypothetical protein